MLFFNMNHCSHIRWRVVGSELFRLEGTSSFRCKQINLVPKCKNCNSSSSRGGTTLWNGLWKGSEIHNSCPTCFQIQSWNTSWTWTASFAFHVTQSPAADCQPVTLPDLDTLQFTSGECYRSSQTPYVVFPCPQHVWSRAVTSSLISPHTPSGAVVVLLHY